MSIALFAGDMKYYRPEDVPPPEVTDSLLADLRVVTAPRETQQAAVEKWLETNTPSAHLLDDLKYFGFIR